MPPSISFTSPFCSCAYDWIKEVTFSFLRLQANGSCPFLFDLLPNQLQSISGLSAFTAPSCRLTPPFHYSLLQNVSFYCIFCSFILLFDLRLFFVLILFSVIICKREYNIRFAIFFFSRNISNFHFYWVGKMVFNQFSSFPIVQHTKMKIIKKCS